jgi:hypothetical protein
MKVKAWLPLKKKDETFKLKPEFRAKVVGAKPPIIPMLALPAHTFDPKAETFKASAGLS